MKDLKYQLEHYEKSLSTYKESKILVEKDFEKMQEKNRKLNMLNEVCVVFCLFICLFICSMGSPFFYLKHSILNISHFGSVLGFFSFSFLHLEVIVTFCNSLHSVFSIWYFAFNDAKVFVNPFCHRQELKDKMEGLQSTQRNKSSDNSEQMKKLYSENKVSCFAFLFIRLFIRLFACPRVRVINGFYNSLLYHRTT